MAAFIRNSSTSLTRTQPLLWGGWLVASLASAGNLSEPARSTKAKRKAGSPHWAASAQQQWTLGTWETGLFVPGRVAWTNTSAANAPTVGAHSYGEVM